jgi:hypothetical protein
MQFGRRDRDPAGTTAKIVGGAALLGMTYFLVRSVPEMIRYWRVSRM